MHGNFHKQLLIALLFVFLIFPFSAHAQEPVKLDTVTVQLWPEFDQPSMLVIYDFTLGEDVSLPVNVTLRIPADATIIAVAYAPPGSNLLNAPAEEPFTEGDWQVLTMIVDTAATYHVEYYAPISFSNTQRDFSYIWPGDYDVNRFNLSLKVPVDTTDVSTDPEMVEITPEDGTQSYLSWNATNLVAGKQIPVAVSYTKTSDRLSMAEQPLETGIVDENTQGRVSLNNYLPYILGGLGLLLIVAGGVYFWQTSKGKPEPRKRHRTQLQDEGEDVYCHQCGKRAQAADRFCRTCGSRLRKES